MATVTSAARARAAFRARWAEAYQRRVQKKIAAGLTRARAEYMATMELAVEGDRELPPGLVDVSTDSDV